MPGLSIHVVDVARGVVASGMRVEVYALEPSRERVAGGLLTKAGILDDRALDRRFDPAITKYCCTSPPSTCGPASRCRRGRFSTWRCFASASTTRSSTITCRSS